MTQLYVKGEKDNKMRQVQHQPHHAGAPVTEAGPDHYWMWLTQDNGKRIYTTVRKDKLIKEKE